MEAYKNLKKGTKIGLVIMTVLILASFVVAVLLLGSAVIVVASFPEFILMRCVSNMTQAICWIALGIAYVARYEEHRAAGLEDK